jgi:2-phosphoglycerate kinase
MAMPFDTLKLARRLEAAGFAPQQAGDMAEAIAEALSALATKADLRAEITALRTELKADIEMLRAELKADMEILKRDMTIRLDSMMVVAVGVILAGFKLIH